MGRVPERPSLEGLEARWGARWEADGTYRFDQRRPREDVYAIDFPPLTVSGSLHLGHVFSYCHPDVLARFQRMRGRAVFYPVGFDDNGLPTERRVENYYGVRCDPSLPYDPDFAPPASPANPKQPKQPISRPNFVELCRLLTEADEQVFERLWRQLGLSVDWSLAYTTIGERARRASQRGFLHSLAGGEAYQAEAPTLWDVTYRTAVAQAEVEDREVPGVAVRVRFRAEGPEPEGQERDLVVETTRPELLAACVALVAHPGDDRYRDLVGTTATTPLFGAPVPVVAHRLADPGKGTGLAMICTFGDLTDVLWWRELKLPVRSIVTRAGRLQAEPPDGVPAGPAWDELAGQTIADARRRVVGLLGSSGDLVGEPRPVTHPVKFYENGDRPLEIVTSRQWFIRLLIHRERLLERGRAIEWQPPYMRARYEHWVTGLHSDWLVSRQRFFGVPVPLWYPLTSDGEVDHDHPIVPDEARLPVDPSTDVPDGYQAADRGRPGGFTGDPDVFDTWATSSLTPQIAGGWEEEPERFAKVFPMQLRPQAHEIIRTWLFYTVVRSDFEHGTLPWSRAAISGWVVDPDRRKMSKSKGNVVTPTALLERYGADALRYWAAGGRPGTDTAVDEGQMRVGRRLAVKLLNSGRFILSLPEDGSDAGGPAEPLDLAMLAGLDVVVADATEALEAADWTAALERVERFFWSFCDDYLELVKDRAYRPVGEPAGGAARAALRGALEVQVRLLAPYLPYACEEVWSWWRDGSVHLAPWPESAGVAADRRPLEAASLVIAALRRAKSQARLPLRTPVAHAEVSGPPSWLDAVRAAETDLAAAGRVSAFGYRERPDADGLGVRVELAPAEEAAT
ncbi:MAG TPA: valine--tRNA ligase [Actinomycetes bacterium]|nr:valine--tRNA ligase [Actinomycetes bacterium]